MQRSCIRDCGSELSDFGSKNKSSARFDHPRQTTLLHRCNYGMCDPAISSREADYSAHSALNSVVSDRTTFFLSLSLVLCPYLLATFSLSSVAIFVFIYSMKPTIYPRKRFYPSFGQVMTRLIQREWLLNLQRFTWTISPGYNPRPVSVRAQPDVEWCLVGFHIMLTGSYLCNVSIITL